MRMAMSNTPYTVIPNAIARIHHNINHLIVLQFRAIAQVQTLDYDKLAISGICFVCGNVAKYQCRRLLCQNCYYAYTHPVHIDEEFLAEYPRMRAAQIKVITRSFTIALCTKQLTWAIYNGVINEMHSSCGACSTRYNSDSLDHNNPNPNYTWVYSGTRAHDYVCAACHSSINQYAAFVISWLMHVRMVARMVNHPDAERYLLDINAVVFMNEFTS